MKLHLPVALLAAVLQAVSLQAATPHVSDSQSFDNGAKYSYSTDETGTVTSTVTGDVSGISFTTTSAGNPSAGGWVVSVDDSYVNANGEQWTASNSVLNIGDENGTDTKANMVIGGGVRGTKVAGDKITNVYDGASVGNLIAGYFYPWGKNTIGYIYSESGPYYDNGATNEDAKILLNITGGSVGAVYGNYLQSNAFQALHVEQGWTAKEDIQIDVSGGNVGVILGAGYNVAGDNSVLVNLSGNAQTGDVYAGALTWNTTDSYVGSTRVTVAENAIINGSVYAGGAYEAEYDYDSYVTGNTLVELNGGTVKGNVYGGGEHGTIHGSTTVVLNGGAVAGNVYAAGIANSVEKGTRVEIHGKADEAVAGKIYGAGTVGNEVVEGVDRVLVFDSHGKVDWDKFENFNAVEFTNTTITELGTDGVLAKNYEKVVINNSHITGRIDHAVELDVTDNIYVALDGDLITKAGSAIVDNEKAINIAEDATFKGTEIANSPIVAGGNIAVTDGSVVSENSTLTAGGKITVSGESTKIADSTVVAGGKNIAVTDGATITNSHLDAADGQVSFTDYSSMKGGEITADSLHIEGAQVEVDSINGGNAVKLSGGALLESVTWPGGYVTQNYLGQGSLKVNGDLVLAKDSDFTGHLREPDTAVLTADSISTEGAVTFTGATVEATKGDISLSAGSELKNTDLSAENGTVKLTQTTMNGGNIVAGEALKIDNTSVVVVDSINGGKAVNLQVPSGQSWNIAEGPKAASLTVNDDLVLADGSRFEGHNKIESPYIHIEGDKNVDALLTAHSIKSEGAVEFDRATVTATEGNIELSAGSSVTNTKLDANDSVQLNGTTMKGGSIDAGNKVVLNASEVSVNSIGTDGAVVDSNKSQLEVTGGALVLNGGSVVKASVLSSKEGVELRGTTMTGSTVVTDGVFSVTKQSDVTMDSVEGLKTIEISDSSFTTGKVELSKGETITSKTSNFTATDIVVNGGNFAADGTIKANSITVSDQGLIKIGDAKGTSKTQMELNATGSQSGLVSGKLEITNTDLVVTGSSSSQFWIDGGTMLVDGKSNVDLSAGTTLRVGSENAGELIVQGGSTLTGGSNNLWVYDNSTITVDGGSKMGVCNDTDQYNYRVLMGITNHDGIDDTTPTQNLNVLGGSTFTSSATQFVTNFHGGTTTNITVSGKDSLFLQTGQTVKETHKAVGTTGEWVEVNGKWFDKGSTGVNQYIDGKGDTITYLLSQGTDSIGALGAAVSNARVNISATEGGSVQFDSALTYVGNVGVNEQYIKANESNYATFTVGKDSSMSFKQMEVYAKADVKNEGTFNATNINVNNGGIFNYEGSGKLIANSLGVDKGGVMNLGSETVRSNVELNGVGSGQTGIISGALNVTNTDLVVTGSSSSQFWIDGGTMTVDKGSKVDLSAGTTLRVGNENAGVLNVLGGSTLTGGANNLWVYDNSTIKVSGEGSVMGVCNDTDHYNYRVLMGITNHDGQDGSEIKQSIYVTDGGTFTSSATQFVTNFHSGSKTEIVADGGTFVQTGTNKNGSHYEVGTTGEWVQDKDGNWLDKGSAGVGGKYVTGNTDTITYLLSNGTDKHGVLGYAVENAQATIVALNGGTVKFDSALTYVGNVGVSDAYINANKSNQAHFIVDETSNMSFKQMEVYATAGVQNKGTFNATNINVNNGGTFNYAGSGKLIANSLGVDKGGVMNLGSETVRSNVELNNAGSGKSGVISGKLNVTNTNLVLTDSKAGAFWIDGGVMTVDGKSTVDLSNGGTLCVGRNDDGVLNVQGGSSLTGADNNLWVYGDSTINVTGPGSSMGVCKTEGDYNYRVLMGITNHDGPQNPVPVQEQNLNVKDGGTFTSSATQFVANFHGNTTTNITVSGKDSLFHQTGQNVNNNHYVVGTTGEWVQNADGQWLDKGSTGDGQYVAGHGDTITYLLSNGTDKNGVLGYAVSNAKVNISATEGGRVQFDSALTYVGNIGVNADYIEANKSNFATFTVGKDSSMSFKQLEIYADTKIDNQGTFNVESVNVNDGATLETLGSLDLNEVALAGGTLFNQGTLSMESLELEHASLLFAATSLTDASAAINYTGTHLTNFGANGSSVSIDDMVDNFGIVLTGAGAQELIDAGETGVTFSFTLATGDATFLSELDTVLSIEENLADFSITVNDAILREGDGELKNLQVTVEGDALVISGTAIIPEPTTATLSLLALAALAARRRRK